MPPRKKQQSNALLYTLIAFVGLFIAAATCAIIFYVKTEDYKAKEAALRRDIDVLATPQEQQRLGTIIGTKEKPSWLGTMVDCFDSAMAMVTGTAPQNIHAQAKLSTAAAEVKKALTLAQQYVTLASADPNTVGLTRVVADLKAALDNTTAAVQDAEKRYAEQKQRYDDAMAATHEFQQILLAQKDILVQKVNEIEQDYNQLKALVEKTADQRIQTALAELDKEKANLDKLNQQLLSTQAQLDLTGQKMKRAQEQVAKTMPPPDSNAPAMIADGKVILIDYNTKLVHIDKGSKDRVYPGLTFAVHDKNAPIPQDGKGKAEIEVFDVQKTFSAARIISENKRKPVLEGDIIANLIWDSARKNVFVIAGNFDLDNDSGLDIDAHTKMKALIEKWGGRVDNAVSVDTDFLVLGKQPEVLKKPTVEQLEIDPQAMDKYEASQRIRDDYEKVRSQAQALWIPIFTYDRFLYFIGYKQQSAAAGAF